jgi:hypothetical protein
LFIKKFSGEEIPEPPLMRHIPKLYSIGGVGALSVIRKKHCALISLASEGNNCKYVKFTVNQLKIELVKRNASTKGRKIDLIER